MFFSNEERWAKNKKIKVDQTTPNAENISHNYIILYSQSRKK
jgi:hypothetical protein